MKLSLVNLVPLKEGGAFGMSAKDLASTYSLKMLQQMRDETMMDMENDPSVEPEGGSQADYYGGTLNGLDQAIALKQPKKDVPYDVAVGKMTQDEYDEYMSTVKPDRASFEKSSKFDRMNESEADYDGEGWDDPRDENGKLIVGDDGVISIGQLSLSKHAVKALNNGEHPSGLKYNAILDKKLEILKSLSASGKFKKDFSDDRFMDWLADNYSWAKIKKQFKNEFREGSCGYGPDGVPGDTPGETQGMDADDRTRGMLRKLIQKEIAKYENK